MTFLLLVTLAYDSARAEELAITSA